METEMWNMFDLKAPPTFTCKLSTDAISFSNLRKLSDVFWDALVLLRNQDTLFTEAATLSRLIYRMKSKFRGDKGFKSIEKVNHCLRHFLSLNLVPIFENFFQTIPWDCSGKEIYCPTRQMLEYIIVRTQGLAALLCRIVHTCLETAFLFRARMSSGHNWQISLLCFGAVSRIWSISKHILSSCVKWYGTMLPFLNTFEPSGPLWLPCNYTFPNDLSQWLEMPWIHIPLPTSQREYMESSVSSDEHCHFGIQPVSFHSTPRIQSIHDDVGVSISRTSFTSPVVPLDGFISSPSSEPKDSDEKETTSSTVKEKTTKQNKNSKMKLKRCRELCKARTNDEGFQKPKHLETHLGNGCSSNDGNASLKQEPVTTSGRNERDLTDTTFKKIISLINSQEDVQMLLNSESRKRSLTLSLDEKQWILLKRLVGKLNSKLKNVQDERKQRHILKQIKKAFIIALS